MDAAEIAKYTETAIPRSPSAGSRLWKRLTRRTDRGAVENIGLRRLHKRVKSVSKQRPKSKPFEHQETSTRSRWLHPFKCVRKRHHRGTYVRLPSVVSSSASLNRSAPSQMLQTRQNSPPVLGTNVLRKQSSGLVSPRDMPVEGTNLTTNTGHRFKDRLSGPSSRTLPSRPSTFGGYHALHKTRSAPGYSGMERRDSHDVQVVIDPSNFTTMDPMPPSAHQCPANIETPAHSIDRTHKITSTTSSDRAEYDRIMKVCFKNPARRTPIPSPWRHTAQRAYMFRGPTSPYRKVATSPMAASNKAAYGAAHGFATEPRRACGMQNLALDTKPESPLRAIAARRKVSVLRPACFAVRKTYRKRVIGWYPTLPMQRQLESGMGEARRLRSSRTLPNDWTLADSEARTLTSETVVAEMASLSMNDAGVDTAESSTLHESEVYDEEMMSGGLSRMSCEDEDSRSLADTEGSDGAVSDEDVWYDVSENPSFEEMSSRF